MVMEGWRVEARGKRHSGALTLRNRPWWRGRFEAFTTGGELRTGRRALRSIRGRGRAPGPGRLVSGQRGRGVGRAAFRRGRRRPRLSTILPSSRSTDYPPSQAFNSSSGRGSKKLSSVFIKPLKAPACRLPCSRTGTRRATGTRLPRRFAPRNDGLRKVGTRENSVATAGTPGRGRCPGLRWSG